MGLRANLATVALAFGLTVTAGAETTPDNSVKPSQEDCAVLAVVGKAMQHDGWPAQPMSRLSFGTNCDWKAFGMVAPVIPPPDPGPYYDGLRFSFSRPVYSADGQQATVGYSLGGQRSASSYFYTGYNCTTHKNAGRWQPAVCTMGFIT